MCKNDESWFDRQLKILIESRYMIILWLLCLFLCLSCIVICSNAHVGRSKFLLIYLTQLVISPFATLKTQPVGKRQYLRFFYIPYWSIVYVEYVSTLAFLDWRESDVKIFMQHIHIFLRKEKKRRNGRRKKKVFIFPFLFLFNSLYIYRHTHTHTSNTHVSFKHFRAQTERKIIRLESKSN